MSREQDRSPILPRAMDLRRNYSWCRHCGELSEMTNEHIPPRSTNNDQPVRRIMEPIDESILRDVIEWQDGHVLPTLDRECNERASRWGYIREYKKWFELFGNRAKRIYQEAGRDPLRGPAPFRFDLPHDFHPARFIRQVLGMFLAVQASEQLFVTQPALTELIGPDPGSDSQRPMTCTCLQSPRFASCSQHRPHAILDSRSAPGRGGLAIRDLSRPNELSNSPPPTWSCPFVSRDSALLADSFS